MRTDRRPEGSIAADDRESPHRVGERKQQVNGPSFDHDDVYGLEQRPQDLVDEALMESFPCSDPPSYNSCHI